MMKKLVFSIVTVSALALAGCGGTDEATKAEVKTSGHGNTTPVKSKTEAAQIKMLTAQFPTEPAKNVVATSVSVTEMLDIVGITPVGIPSTTHKLPDNFTAIPKIGSAVEPDVEKIASLNPDLVIGSESIKDSIDKKISQINLKGAYLPTDSYPDLKVSLEVLGTAFDKEKAATTYLTKLQKDEDKIVSSIPDKTAPKVMILFGTGSSFMLMNDTTYVGSLVKTVKAKNIVTETMKTKESYVPLNMEDVTAANPDAILLVSHGDANAALTQFKADVKKNGAWEKLNAFKNDKVQALDYDIFGYASLANATTGLEQLKDILYK